MNSGHTSPRGILAILILLGLAAGCASVGIDEPEVEENPGCGISCVVRWSTTVPATSAVEFGEDDQLTHRVEDSTLSTEHEVVVVGMRASSFYRLQAVSVTEAEVELRSEDLEFETRALPYPWMAGDVDIDEPDLRQPGWTLSNVCTGVFCPTVIVLLDESGQPVWYHVADDETARADIETTWLGDGRILVGPGVPAGQPVVQVDLLGDVVWSGPSQPDHGGAGTDLDDLLASGVMHHTLQLAEDGRFIAVLFDQQDGVLGDVIWEFDEDLATTWSWNAFDHLEVDPESVGLFNEWTHINSVSIDVREDVLYANSWNLDRVFKIDRADGGILWALGAGGDFTADTTAVHPWFIGAHSIEPLGDDRFLLYDNGGSERSFSRLVEYKVDEVAMSARIVWEYPGPGIEDAWYNLPWGDVDPLPNGNRLMSAGNASQGYDQTRIQEVTRDGDIAWRMWWTLDEEIAVGSFHVQRIPALAVPIGGDITSRGASPGMDW